MHKVFISFHRGGQKYKDSLVQFGEENTIFVDRSVDTGDNFGGIERRSDPS